LKKFFSTRDRVVPMHHPRVLVETAVAHGADRHRLLENVGITSDTLSDSDARISYEQFETLEHNALRLTNNPALGLYFGRAMHLSHFGLLGLAVMSSLTVEDAFRVGLQYYRLVAPAWDIDLSVEGDRAFLRIRETIARGTLHAFSTEALLTGLNGVAIQVLGGRLPVHRVRVDYPRPEYAAIYADFFAFPIQFDQDATEAVFDASVLGERIRSADPATATLAEQHCATEASRRVPVDGLVGRIRTLLQSTGAGRPTLEEVARSLQTSARSLRRNLQQMGMSYQAILDEELRVRAEQQVRAGDAKFEQIARELGFSDVRSFRRAFKRWTGQNPNEFRETGGSR
jgi:AraC-like DNA-binding protein